ncbi:uncharacterized protein [Ptychodera flava]|uniref:uncharacterized protein n=1 Tax=Ptychodera flava TaxID=63121 RepID=UPI00396A939B
MTQHWLFSNFKVTAFHKDFVKWYSRHWCGTIMISVKKLSVGKEQLTIQMVLSFRGAMEMTLMELTETNLLQLQSQSQSKGHCKFCSSREVDNIVICSPDTDVFMLAVSCAHQLQSQLFLHQTSKNGQIIHINKITEALGDETAQALVGLHVFSGCDSVSAFRGKGKKKMANMLLMSDTYTDTFQELGTSWTVSDKLMTQIESFVCELYGQDKCSNVNEARYNCFRLGSQNDGALPPNKDSLTLHTQRANYQTAIYRLCLQAKMDAPSPHGHGWIVQDSELSIQWMSFPPAPDSIINFVSCKCKKSGCSSRCSCREVELLCTELCQYVSCTNTYTKEQNECVEDESDDSCSDIDRDPE